MAVTNLRKFLCPEVVFGAGARNLSGRYAKNLRAKKLLVVTDKGVQKTFNIDSILQSLSNEGIEYVVFSDVSPNPRTHEVMAGTEIYKANSCDSILAIGGGSPMDCAKGIGIVSSNNRHITMFEGVDKIATPLPPLIFVPTTAGTSSDVSQFTIISNEDEKRKFAVISKTIIPDIALIDPETTMTMPTYLTACTGIDALVHAIEAYVSTANSPITDVHAAEAIRLVSTYLPKVIANPNNLEYRTKVMLASFEAGLAFSNAILGAVHAMSHSLGGFLDLPHGECNAILLNHVVDFNFDFAEERYSDILRFLGSDTSYMTTSNIKKSLIDNIISLKKSVGITKTLSNTGVKHGDLYELSKKAVKDPCLITNPRKANEKDIEVVFANAL